MALDEDTNLDEIQAAENEDQLAAGDDAEAGDDNEEQLAAGDDAGGDDGSEEAPAATRGQTRMQRLANERAQEREARVKAEAEALAARQQAEFYRQQVEAAQRQQAAPEDQYVDPDEKWRRDAQSTLERGLAQAADMQDKSDFTLKAVNNPLYAQYRDRVEAELNKLRMAGQNANRETIFKYLLGEDAVANYGKKSKTAQAAAARVKSATRPPASAKSDVGSQRSDKSAGDRLQGVIL
jgi:hypothetical protein